MLLQRTIREGYETETKDGRPAAPLMGKRLDFDQGRMYLSFSPFTQLVATNFGGGPGGVRGHRQQAAGQ